MLIVGGSMGVCCPWSLGASHTAALYSAAEDRWSHAGMIHARESMPLALLPDGRVLVTGGHGAEIHSSAEIFHPRTRSWSWAAPMLAARRNHSAVVLPDGRVLVVGGFNDEQGPVRLAEIYTP